MMVREDTEGADEQVEEDQEEQPVRPRGAWNLSVLAANYGKGKDDDEPIEFSSGVKLRCKAAPSRMLDGAIAKLKVPEVPTIYIEERGRTEPNPNDPDYAIAVQKYDADCRQLQLNVMVVFGTEIAEIPEGVPKPDDDEWVEMAKAAGVEVPEGKYERYLAWVDAVAAPSVQDYYMLTLEVGRRTGVHEEDVLAAVARFPGVAARAADNGASVDEPSTDRNNARAKPRRSRARSGGKGGR